MNMCLCVKCKCSIVVFCWLHMVYNIDYFFFHTQEYPHGFKHIRCNPIIFWDMMLLVPHRLDRWSSSTVVLDWACTVMELHLHDCIIRCISCARMVVVVCLIVNSVLAIWSWLLGDCLYLFNECHCTQSDRPDGNDIVTSLLFLEISIGVYWLIKVLYGQWLILMVYRLEMGTVKIFL